MSGWTRRQVLRHLAHLQAHGLAQVSANAERTRPQTLPTLEATSVEQVVRDRISLERQVFRERASAWVLARRASIAACQERAQRWWAGLDVGERALRVQRLSGEFSRLSV
ncbi:maleylpyruvate isomerase N-terminal domain-containing protein [Dermacoccus nishinomiyaensis]|uniref:maleylpyruvate isomerase N-terminal domain-containing protein n=1 Tax=Dermacoccus nishinomiyaensis TaxID=1274 RepID=UPI0030B84F81